MAEGINYPWLFNTINPCLQEHCYRILCNNFYVTSFISSCTQRHLLGFYVANTSAEKLICLFLYVAITNISCMDYDTKPMTYIAKSKNLALTFQEYYVYLRKFEYSIVFSPNFYQIA